MKWQPWKAIKEAGIIKYRFLATLDNNTSEICRSLDKQEFEVEKAMPGENCPPMHPNCRSTTEAVFEDEIESTRIARTEDGSQYMVPRDMNYAEWKEKYVNNLPVHADVLRGVDRIDITDTDVVKSTLEHYEALILNETVENAIVITTTGKIIHCIGDLNGVHHEILGDELSGAIITHNHPMGSDNEYSFSSANIMLFNEYNVRTLRGIDERYI